MNNEMRDEYEAFMKHVEEKSLEELQTYAEFLVERHHQKAPKWLCVNHIMEVYLYSYWENIDQDAYEYSPYHLQVIYRQMAKLFEERREIEQAEKYYKEALLWNPVDLDTIFASCSFYCKNKDWYAMKETAQMAYPYIFTKADMAKYYRYLGVFFVETYQPKLALALYHYSNMYAQSKMADKEIEFLRAALKNEEDCEDVAYLQQTLKDAEIALQPAQETLGLLYQVGKSELEEGNTEYAKVLLMCLYELTGDQNVADLMK